MIDDIVAVAAAAIFTVFIIFALVWRSITRAISQAIEQISSGSP